MIKSCDWCADRVGGEDCQFCEHANKGDGKDSFKPTLSFIMEQIAEIVGDMAKVIDSTNDSLREELVGLRTELAEVSGKVDTIPNRMEN